MREKLTIPIKPYLLRYIQAEMGSTNPVIPIDANKPIGAFVMGLIETGACILKKMKEPDFHIDIELEVPVRDELGKTYDGRSSGLHISQKNIDRFNEFFDFMMTKELYAKLDILIERDEANRVNGRMKQTINDWIDTYQIDDLSYDTIKKRYYRHRKNEQNLMGRVI